MKAKFKQGEKALLKGDEVSIVVSQKNFSTKKITYLLADGRKVPETDLTALKGRARKETPEILEARETYAKLFNETVAISMKNNLVWMKTKIAEAEALADADNDTEATSTTTRWEALDDLEGESLLKFIELQGLEIDPEDYETESELKIAIAEELDIEVSE